MATDFEAADVSRIIALMEYVQRSFRDLYSVSPNSRSREMLVLLQKTNGNYPHFFVNMDTGMVVVPPSDIRGITEERLREHLPLFREIAMKGKRV